MASTSEVGHAKNVANFEDLISFCTGYGVTYNPSQNAIKIAQLNTLKTNANNSIATVVTTNNVFKNATNNRELVFEPVKKLSTKIMAALKACGASDLTIEDATTINHKIQGKGSKIKIINGSKDDTKIADPSNPPVSPEEPKSISTSQQSYDSLIEHFTKLIDLLSSIPAYSPNENELKVSTLNALLSNMKTANTNVINAYTSWSNARIVRNDILYKKTVGLIDIALEVKNYVKSIYGAKSPQYKQVSVLKFKRV